ncbi:MAG: sigma-54-dependent Fis family transcriptional regulator [Acidobacteria bacterium]|nr:sigma-54-dependent Fis family transcriptional regulator [Acidobacteriota bacterium]
MRTAIRECFPPGAAGVRLLTAVPESFSGSVYLALARFSADAPAGLGSRLRESCRAEFLVGWVCARGEDPAGLFSQLDEFDDFLFCPFGEAELISRIRRLCRPERSGNSVRPARLANLQLDSLVGESAAFLRLLEMLPAVARCDATVLISGETGTGKELLARAIHYNSVRRGKPFVPVNCGALPDALFENEMFGHARGAFTGAGSAEKGLLAAADGGTVFLDEVGTLSAAAQIKLLRFLQDHEYRPLGSTERVVADVRIVAATNTDLQVQVQAGHLREDLFHRLNVLTLHMPALRERREDIPPLAEHMLARYERQYGRQGLHFSRAALEKLKAYSWPGNVRELEGVIQRAMILSFRRVLESADLQLPGQAAGPALDGTFGGSKRRVVEEFERAYVIRALAEHGGNVSRAALAAGKDRRAFQRLIRKYSLHQNSGGKTRAAGAAG